MNPTTPSEPSKFSVVIGGEDHRAILVNGQRLTVRVRAVPARHLLRVLQLADKEAELLDFVCYLPRAEGAGFDPVEPGWSDNLSRESHVLLYQVADRQNFSAAAAWAERQIAAKRRVDEIMLKAEEVMQPVMERMLQSLEPLLRRLSSPAAPSTKSSTDSPTGKS